MSSIWPVLHYDDTERALAYLTGVLGLAQTLVARDDAGAIVHAELGAPGGGALNFGGTRHKGGVHGTTRAGASAVYVVAADEAGVDAVHERVAADGGGAVLQAPNRTSFGSGADAYATTVTDFEGNLWTFGTYAGA